MKYIEFLKPIHYVIILLLLIIIILFYCSVETFDNNNIKSLNDIPNTDWSNYWNDLDFKARKEANCTPIKKDYTRLGTMDSWILTMPISCENGMPHTRAEDVIAMPEGFSKDKWAKTIEHEKIHLNQRKDFNNWKKFYKLHWNYDVYENPPTNMPESLVKMKRANPDTCFAPYACWNNIWWSVPVYKSLTNLNFRSCPVKWWNQKENKIYDNPPQEWVDFFGEDVSQAEHPNEISAVYIANALFNKPTMVPGLKILMKKWNIKKEELNN